MKVRTRFSYYWGVIFCGMMLVASCSDDTPSKAPDTAPSEESVDKPSDKPSEKPEDQPGGGTEGDSPEGENGLSEELLQKLHTIYDHANIGPQRVTSVHELAILTSYCASAEVAGPISVTPASLNNQELTLITLGGTEEKEGQATTLKESQLASFGQSNDYLTAVRNLFVNEIVPKHKPVLVTGISLGGMIAQQLLGDSLVNADYEVLGIITFGSPLNVPLDRKGVKVVRFADTHDKVPQLGEIVLRTGMATPGMNKKELRATLDQLDQAEKITRTSQYTEMIPTHALSYIDEPCWNDVDFLGDPTKKNVLELQATLKFYPAPIQNTSED